MDFGAFIESAWNDHADSPEAVADRLVARVRAAPASAQRVPLARLVTHVFGEHLGRWQQGADLIDSMRGAMAPGDGSDVARMLAHNAAALRVAAGDRAAIDTLAQPDRVAALATASSALSGRAQFKEALAAFDAAITAAQAGLPQGSPAIRALAVCGNNLAAALEEKADRDAYETRGMVTAATAGLTYWKLAGTWLEEERAEYRLARSLLQAGDAPAAVQAASRCLSVCTANDAPAFEAFFAHAALALAQRASGGAGAFVASRAAALDCLARVPEEDRRWCEADLKAISD
jgi:hypothetical protein